MAKEAIKRTLSQTMLMLADGADRVAKYMEKYGFKGIGRGVTFQHMKPVCVVGHIIQRAKLKKTLFEDTILLTSAPTDNVDIFARLGLSVRNGVFIEDVLTELTSENDDEEGRTKEEVVKHVRRLEKELRKLALKEQQKEQNGP